MHLTVTDFNMTTVSQSESQPERRERANLSWLLRFVRNSPRPLVGSIVSGIVGGVAVIMEPFLIGSIVDHLNDGADSSVILVDVLLLIVFGVVTVIAFYAQRYYSGELSYNVNYDVRQVLFDRMLEQDQAFFNQYSTGDLISRLHSDVDMVWRLVVLSGLRLVSSLTGLIIIFILLASVSIPLTAAAFLVLLVTTSFQVWAGLSLAPKFEQVQQQGGVMAGFVQDAITGIQTIKAFGTEAETSAAFAQSNADYRRRWLYFKRRNEPVGMLPNAISQLTTGIVVLFGGLMAINGQITLGNFAQFLIYLGLISQLLLNLGVIYQRLQQTRGALQRLTPMLQSPGIQSPRASRSVESLTPEIRFENVTLVLDNEVLLDDITLTIPAGKTVAIVGATGSGKSLLVGLIGRIHDPTAGRVTIGGVDVRDLMLEDLRSMIAYVPQTTFLFSQTLQENLRMGTADADDDAVAYAMHVSRLSNDLAQLTDGLDTLVGEKGVMLSGGQKQRLAIARAVIRNPSILIMDDALSSVDTRTAADILADLREVVRSRTSIVIAHRVATVRDADFIVVMHDGKIVQQGTHEELVTVEGHYRRTVLHELQDVAHVAAHA